MYVEKTRLAIWPNDYRDNQNLNKYLIEKIMKQQDYVIDQRTNAIRH